MLSKPLDGESLVLYLAVSEYSISAVLVREEDRQQSSVYYVSKLLHDAETRYTSMEKLVYTLILASRKLRLCGYSTCVSRRPPSDSAIHFKFYATNNDAEYEALINGLKIALEMGVRNLITRSDSELVVNQVNGGFQARGPRTELYLRCTKRLIGMFKEVRLECVPREKNSNADALAKMGSQKKAMLLRSIPLEIQKIPSIPEIEIMQVDEIPKKTWMTPILAYIHKGTLAEDKFKARRLRYQAARYVIYDEVLYKRGFNQPLLRCVDEEEGNYILREVHEGICGNHSGGSSLAMKVLRQGYYWPTMKEDAINFVRACDRCQHFANYSSMPVTLLTPMASPWPFAMWGIDLIGELPKAKGDVKYAVVAVDYFTKWAEAMPLATITVKKIRDFVFNSIVCRKVKPNTKNPQHGVFGANWEGPYRIKAILGKGTYHLEDMEGKLVLRAWNAEHLRKYY
ncbi:uncharacterized protein LOC141673810 [Apium graveolens]|uniref:uncharacterized protein LOC141673810 n=1 Tax=Apium graveolens TaxID=4045 RepID=UPI003D795E89